MASDFEARIRNVTAVLGPTNTGKTHLAIERMLGHESGMIGLPLRLLAREVYDKIKARVGADKVALITGEEKIKPERRATGSRPSKRCRAISMSSSSPSMKSNCAAIPSAATFSPIGCCMRADARKRCCSARKPCATRSAI